jgi:uncharacterized protein YkwD
MKQNVINSILSLAILFLCLQCATKPPKATPTPGTTTNNNSTSKFTDDILDNVNQYRASKGLAALKLNDVISAEAEKHSENMATGRVAFGHDGFASRIQRISSQLGPAKMSAENVALGELSAKQVVTNWINSPAHRENMEGNFTLTGIGTAKNKSGVIYFTQIFIRN